MRAAQAPLVERRGPRCNTIVEAKLTPPCGLAFAHVERGPRRSARRLLTERTQHGR